MQVGGTGKISFLCLGNLESDAGNRDGRESSRGGSSNSNSNGRYPWVEAVRARLQWIESRT